MGAPAAWSSNAVAGVINVILDTKYEDVKTVLQGGISGEGDEDEIRANIAIGKSFSDGKGHFIGSLTYSQTGERGPIGDRSWFRGTKSVKDDDGKWFILDNIALNNAYDGGVIVDNSITLKPLVNILKG